MLLVRRLGSEQKKKTEVKEAAKIAARADWMKEQERRSICAYEHGALAGAAAGWTNTAKFFHDQIPSNSYIRALDPRSQTVVWQLSSCYFLLGMLSFVFFRSLRQAVKDAFIQEYMMKRYLACLAIADVEAKTNDAIWLWRVAGGGREVRATAREIHVSIAGARDDIRGGPMMDDPPSGSIGERGAVVGLGYGRVCLCACGLLVVLPRHDTM
ncbi:hypothetical protein FRB98_009499 [Tulasnella sp. 332]|nr:hypothetical protein FRB98_009499 [Tulasnella sp. 332]